MAPAAATVPSFDVFISHSSHDKTVADALCATLERERLRCWIAPRDIRPGAEWGEGILDGIEASRAIVLLLSAAANDSEMVLREAEHAASHRLPFLTVRIEDLLPSRALKFYLSVHHWFDAFTPPVEPHFLRLADSIKALLPPRGSPLWPTFLPRVPPPPPASPLDAGEIGKPVTVQLPGGVPLTLCHCPAGRFVMGSPESEEKRSADEKQVTVTISRPFWLGQMQVTQAQWRAVMGTDPSKFKGEDLPVENVNWEEAQECMRKLNATAPLPGVWRWVLPTEAQWEYACRAGTATPFSFGNVLDGTQANCDGNFPYGTTAAGPNPKKTRRVGRYPANGWGLYDMHGNVWEWCEDAWDGRSVLPGGADPVGRTGVDRVVRGGSWAFHAQFCRSAFRYWVEPGLRARILGLRLAAGQE